MSILSVFPNLQTCTRPRALPQVWIHAHQPPGTGCLEQALRSAKVSLFILHPLVWPYLNFQNRTLFMFYVYKFLHGRNREA